MLDTSMKHMQRILAAVDQRLAAVGASEAAAIAAAGVQLLVLLQPAVSLGLNGVLGGQSKHCSADGHSTGQEQPRCDSRSLTIIVSETSMQCSRLTSPQGLVTHVRCFAMARENNRRAEGFCW
jgi:hypothetical protein